MSRKDLTILVFVAALFGASFLFIRVAAPVLGPLPVAGGRVALGAAVLLVVLSVTGQLRALRGRALDLLVVGFLLAAFPFTLFAVAELRITASLAAVLNATTPLWGIVVARIWLGTAVTGRRVLGAAIGIAGVSAAVGLGTLPLDATTLAAAAACLVAALSYAVGSVWTARRLGGTPPYALAAGQQLGATALLAGPVAVAGTAHPPTLTAVAAVAALGLLGTGVAFVLWFGLLARVGPVAAVTVTFLAPVFGVAWAAIFLGEPITLGLVVGTAAVLAGVALIVDLAPAAPKRERRERSAATGPAGALHGAGERRGQRRHVVRRRGVAQGEAEGRVGAVVVRAHGDQDVAGLGDPR
jgi:drug/metabolite transporter (DMT)-like permease